MNRQESLDWLRGLMAFAIMIYHLTGWQQVAKLESGTLLGNLGIYGVSIFFVLSGLSMAIVYHHYIKDAKSSLFFFLRRLFRIWPLLWICILLVSALNFILKDQLYLYKIFINLTTLFGFIAPDQYINTGAWSIGNEMVYYAITPLIIALYNYKNIYGNIFTLFTVIIGLYFAFYALDSSSTLAQEWSTYVNPFNNLFLYVCGIAIYYNFHDINFKNTAIPMILVSLILLTYYPVSGDQINIVTNTNRLIFSFCSILITFGFYKLTISLPHIVTKPLANLGEATYGVYLLHPIVYMFTSRVIDNSLAVITITSILTIIVANIAYRLYEKPFIKLGKKLTSDHINKSPKSHHHVIE